MNPIQGLSLKQARKLVIASQLMSSSPAKIARQEATLKVVEQLGYIQIDTISVVERAHHHTLWSRLPRYSQDDLFFLQKQRQIFEYWSHAAAYLPIRDFRYSLPRKQAIASGERHWYASDAKLNQKVLDRVRAEGPLQAKDFESDVKRDVNKWGGGRPSKRALEQLFMQGELMIAERKGFQKVYDLTERVLPAGIDVSTPTEEQHIDHLIRSYLSANGLGSAPQIAYLLKGMRAKVENRCRQLCEDNALDEIQVNGLNYYVLPDFDKKIPVRPSTKTIKILSPFDNLLIQRKRTLELFGFDYQIECYVPAKKRRYGYFCLPLLWGQDFAGRLDAKINRKTGVLSIMNLHMETTKHEQFAKEFAEVMWRFLKFNQGNSFELVRVSSPTSDNDKKLRDLIWKFLVDPNTSC